MFCPECGSEFVDAIEVCSTCNAKLVAETPELSLPPWGPDPVVVLRSTHAESVAVAKSILLDAGIEYGVHGEHVQDLFTYGRFPAGHSLFMGPIEVLVASQDADDARVLLANLQDDAADLSADDSPLDTSDAEPFASRWGRARKVGKVVAALMLAAFFIQIIVFLVARALGK